MIEKYTAIIADYWKKLEPRERKIVLIGGFVAIAILCYAFIFEPFFHSVTTTKQEVTSKQALVVWMQHAVPRIQMLRKSGLARKSIGDESLLSFLDNSSRSARLRRLVIRLAQSSDQKQVSISFDAVPFDDLISWLTEIWKTYGITVNSADIQKQPKSGIVRADLTLQ